MELPFHQVDVFGASDYLGNPVAVVGSSDGRTADDLTSEQMQRFAQWTNLSETTFVLRPTDEGTDYRVRIFTPSEELPFAGHPTLGTCHTWLSSGGTPKQDGVVVQQCTAGLITIRNTEQRLAFAAPPRIRSGAVDEATLSTVASDLGIGREQIIDAQWVDNGPGWVAVQLPDVESLLAIRPGTVSLPIGALAFYPSGSEHTYEVRGFFPVDGLTVEDPVTGSLNASLAQWLVESGRATPPYVVGQGQVIGRRGEVSISADNGELWVGGATKTMISGTVHF